MKDDQDKKEPTIKRLDRDYEPEKPKSIPEKWAVEIMVKTKVRVKGVLLTFQKGVIKNPPRELLDAADGGVIRKFKL